MSDADHHCAGETPRQTSKLAASALLSMCHYLKYCSTVKICRQPCARSETFERSLTAILATIFHVSTHSEYLTASNWRWVASGYPSTAPFRIAPPVTREDRLPLLLRDDVRPFCQSISTYLTGWTEVRVARLLYSGNSPHAPVIAASPQVAGRMMEMRSFGCEPSVNSTR